MGRAIAAILASIPTEGVVDWRQLFEEWLHPDNDLLASRDTQPELDDLVYFVANDDQITVRRRGKASIPNSQLIEWKSSFMLNMIARLACWLRVTQLDSNLKVQQQWGERVFASPHRGVKQVWPLINFAGNLVPIEVSGEGMLIIELVVCWDGISENERDTTYRPLKGMLLFQGAVTYQKLLAAKFGDEILLKSPQGNDAQAILSPSNGRRFFQFRRRAASFTLEGILIPSVWLTSQLLNDKCSID